MTRHWSSPAKSGPPRDRPPAPAPPPPPRWRTWVLLLGVVATVLLLMFASRTSGPTPTNLSFTDFQNDVIAGKVQTATIESSGKVSGTLAGGEHYTSQIPVVPPQNDLAALLQQHRVQVTGKPPSTGGVSIGLVILDLLPLLIVIGLFWWAGRGLRRQLAGGGGIMGGVGKSKAKVYDAERPSTTFADVAGYEGVKAEVSEVVDFLKTPARYERAGAVGPKGVLMLGPPGTGKTLIARAVAGEAGVPFLALTGSSFVEMFVGVGASRVRDLFADARKRAPSIIFIDEIDAIGGRRGGVAGFGANDEREQTLNQLLAEMDGFDPATGVVVMAATNRPETLDPALLRPGRFDRRVEIPLPNLAEREAILAVHARGKHLDPDVDLSAVARGTPGFSGADLANLVNEGAIHAVRDDRTVITAADLDAARDRILLGRRESSNALLPEEKHAVAIHETGHAMVAALSEHTDPVSKVTILPAGQALGVTEQLPEAERRLYPESWLEDSLAVRLGGRAAERLVLGEASTGAANDLAGATQLAVRMVREWGLSQRVGPIGYSSDGPAYLGDGGFTNKPYAEETQRAIDEEVARLLRDAEQRATDLLQQHRSALDQVVDLLLEKETIDGDELLALLGDAAARPPEVRRPVPAVAPAAGVTHGPPADSGPNTRSS